MKISNKAQDNLTYGIMVFLIVIGMGGCKYLCDKGDAVYNQSKQENSK